MINFKKQIRGLKRDKRRMMNEIGNNGIQMFKVNNFNAQGFIDRGVNKWKKKKKPDGKRILVKTSFMRNSLNFVIRGFKILYKTATDYAKVHNEGLKSGRGSGFTMPKRQIAGDSAALNKINKKTILKFIKKNFS